MSSRGDFGQIFATWCLLLEISTKRAETRIVSVLWKLLQHIVFRAAFKDSQRPFVKGHIVRKSVWLWGEVWERELECFGGTSEGRADGVRDAEPAGICQKTSGVSSLLATDFSKRCFELAAKDGLGLLGSIDHGLTVAKQYQLSHAGGFLMKGERGP